MTAANETLTGAFAKDPGTIPSPGPNTGVVVQEQAQATLGVFSGYTLGATRVAQVQPPATLMQAWNVLGWSIQLRAGLLMPSSSTQIFARFGDLWGGLMVDTVIGNSGGDKPGAGATYSGGAQFPADLSPFSKLWEGSTVQLRQISQIPFSSYDFDDLQCSLIAETFMLPTPVLIRAGTPLQMALVLTPSLMKVVAGNLFKLVIVSASYSLIYSPQPV